MTFKDFIQREKHVALHAQSARFRVIKYLVLLTIATLVYWWRDLATVGQLFLILFCLAIALHFFFRWKTEAWTKSWGLYKRIKLNDE